jgi:hypothetical protein
LTDGEISPLAFPEITVSVQRLLQGWFAGGKWDI